jgi:hypothetical protein
VKHSADLSQKHAASWIADCACPAAVAARGQVLDITEEPSAAPAESPPRLRAPEADRDQPAPAEPAPAARPRQNASNRRNDDRDQESAPAAETLCLDADGTVRPMREVLDERKRNEQTLPKAEREAAYRERAWMIALLQACTCGYPRQRAETESEHATWCIAHRWHSNAAEAARRTR